MPKHFDSFFWYWLLNSCHTCSTGSAAAAAKSLQSCPTLCNPIDGSPPGSPVPGILQARTLERVAISFSNAWKWKVKVKLLSRLQLFATPWTAVYQAPPPMGFSRQEYWSGLPLPSPNVSNHILCIHSSVDTYQGCFPFDHYEKMLSTLCTSFCVDTCCWIFYVYI